MESKEEKYFHTISHHSTWDNVSESTCSIIAHSNHYKVKVSRRKKFNEINKGHSRNNILNLRILRVVSRPGREISFA